MRWQDGQLLTEDRGDGQKAGGGVVGRREENATRNWVRRQAEGVSTGRYERVRAIRGLVQGRESAIFNTDVVLQHSTSDSNTGGLVVNVKHDEVKSGSEIQSLCGDLFSRDTNCRRCFRAWVNRTRRMPTREQSAELLSRYTTRRAVHRLGQGGEEPA